MSISRWPRLFPQSWAIMWLAGCIVPKSQRAEWRGRRRSELWHWCSFLVESGRDSQQSRLELSHYCWHAFADAFWRRFEREDFLRRLDHALRSWRFCLLGCASTVLIVVIGSGFLPITRSVLWPLPYANAGEIATVSHAGMFSPFRSGVPWHWLPAWSQQSKSIAGIAEYNWKQTAMSTARSSSSRTVLIGQVSPNFFDLLGVGAQLGRTFRAGDDSDCGNCVVLSYPTWSRFFGKDPAILGRTISVDEIPAQVIGVLPSRFWFGSQQVAVWTVLSDRGNAGLDPKLARAAFPPLVGALVRLRPGVNHGQAEDELRQIAQSVWPGKINRVSVQAVQGQARQMLYPYGLALLVSVALVFAMKHFGMSDHLRHRSQKVSAVRWWAFFLGKTGFLLLTAILLSIEVIPAISRIFAEPSDPVAWLLSAWLCLGLCVAALLWSMRDQRLRCRVCLCRLTLPVFVGDAGRVLFSRGATELVCPEGHGVLHVSEAPCSWIEAEEWMQFDESWEVMFREDNRKPPA